MRTHKEVFTEIYDKNIWGGSGGGSSPENTVEYRILLQKFMLDHKIRSVVDWGCGDWSFSRLMDWTDVWYVGVDCVDSVIKDNQKKYGKQFINFHSPEYNNGASMLILKDVLQHWTNDEIVKFIDECRGKFKYIWICNTLYEGDRPDILAGDCCGMSAKFEPLKRYNPEILAVIQTTITSEVSLIKNI